MEILDRFLSYVEIPTTSDYNGERTPSTKEQFNLANHLVKELNDLGLIVNYDREHCYVYACLKGNVNTKDKIGFVAHMDTSPNAKGHGIKPKIIKNYDGKDIILNSKRTIDVTTYPDLKNHIGKTLITTDGNTLLGADDKAGITEIMTMIEYFANNDVEHGDIYVAFTPDEEIGNGTKYFDFDRFKANIAYTVDGVSLGEINYENFNAAAVEINIQGVDIHPGFAKDKMVNSLLIANAIVSSLPNETPANTEGREGFYHLRNICGTVDHTSVKYIIRDHDRNKFEKRKQLLTELVKKLNEKYNNRISLKMKDTAYNMREIIEKDIRIVDNVIKSTKKINIEPLIIAVRGGTDGARLSYMGLPCPNIGAGGHNFHSVYEYVALEDMESVSKILIEIVKSYTNQKPNEKQKINTKK